MSSSTAMLIGVLVLLSLTMPMGILLVIDMRVASPAQIQEAVKACPGVSERLKFAVEPVSIGELHTLQGYCERQVALSAQKNAAEVPYAPK